MRLDQEAPRAPYLLCAARTTGEYSQRCRQGATCIRDGYAVCAQHAEVKRLRLALSAVPYDVLEPMIGDQFSRGLR